MQDFDQLKQAKEKCLNDLVGALPLYRERLDSIDQRLYVYIDDALSNHASHANLMELLGIRKGASLVFVLILARKRLKMCNKVHVFS